MAILRRFPNISEDSRRLPRIPENWRRFPKMFEDCRRLPTKNPQIFDFIFVVNFTCKRSVFIAVSQLITSKSSKQQITSPQMTCTSSIITNVQQDDKSTDGDVAHHLESSTAPKDDQRCVWNPLTVRAGRIFGTSKHVRYSEYSEHEKESNN